ncbi:MAG: hypothetical protein M1831_000706 [Alyxoria varia]|nr:MAG: hypothetical protein M1831_000706 [Alyxoria varia]
MAPDKSKKRKRTDPSTHNGAPHTSKPSASFRPTPGGRRYTVSVALPGSVIANAQTHDLKTQLAGQIARALTVFRIDEIIIYDDGTALNQGAKPPNLDGPSDKNKNNNRKPWQHDSNRRTEHQPMDEEKSARLQKFKQRLEEDQKSGYTGWTDPSNFLVHILSFLETPQYLRRTLFAVHPNLKTSGSLPSLDAPHHLREDEWVAGAYREGVTLPKRRAEGDAGAKEGHTLVEAGLSAPVEIPVDVPAHTRVTLKFKGQYAAARAEAVDPQSPRREGGFYWGYSVRRAESLSAVFTECPFTSESASSPGEHDDDDDDDADDNDNNSGKANGEDDASAEPEGYDYCIGTSERGTTLRPWLSKFLSENTTTSTFTKPPNPATPNPKKRKTTTTSEYKPPFSHLLVTFGGPAGLEAAAANDASLKERGVAGGNVADVFDAYVDFLEGGQGSRTVRTEEAVWCGLMGLRGLWM